MGVLSMFSFTGYIQLGHGKIQSQYTGYFPRYSYSIILIKKGYIIASGGSLTDRTGFQVIFFRYIPVLL